MIVSIASGKGGTGKTTVAVNLALALSHVQLLDCDVEEPNVHLLLKPKVNQVEPVYVSVPRINEGLCDHCGRCAEFCEYNALFVGVDKVLVFPNFVTVVAAVQLFALNMQSSRKNTKSVGSRWASLAGLK